MEAINRKKISELIVEKIKKEGIEKLSLKYFNSGKINFLIIKNLLPMELADQLSKNFVIQNKMVHLNEIQENKYVGVYFQNNEKIVEEALYSFQEDNVIKIISKITNICDLTGDKELYAGGISSMSKDCFLNPHIDNSHNRLMTKYRRLNLLYYVNKDWDSNKDGGELVLYPDGINGKQILIANDFNSLVIFRTDNRSFHGVNPVKSETNRRKCISNYYFSNASPLGKKYYHSTSYIGFKGQFLKGSYLKANGITRTIFKKIIFKLFKKSISTGLHKDN